MTKSVSAKMGIKPGGRARLIDAPADAIDALALPPLDVQPALTGMFDYIFLFVTRQQAMHEQFATLKEHLKPTGTLWLAWPKAKQLQTDLTLTKVIEIGYTYGLVESKVLGINTVWSTIKFTHPKEGKVYTNSYGTLPT